MPIITSRWLTCWYVCECPTISIVYGWFAMIVALGLTPGAVVAVALSWRTMNVYVVGCDRMLSSQVACVVVHAFAAMYTTFAVHALPGGAIISE